MNFFDIVSAIIIDPIIYVLEFIFARVNLLIANPAFCIIILSLSVSVLTLPLYRRADAIQMDSRKKEEEIRPVVNHISKSFKGDEKILMLQAYYRIKKYSSLYSLKGLLSLILQIPFFIAAYRFLSKLPILGGCSFGPIKDLMTPDSLIVIGGISINVLPILMTVINLISSAIIVHGQPLKNKVALYLSAAIFLVLLYNSPSGLVLYWTMNNVFSLLKNIYHKVSAQSLSQRKTENDLCVSNSEKVTFWMGVVYLALLGGYYIPSGVINSCVEDFIGTSMLNNPSIYVYYPLFVFFGFFVLWIGVYYVLSGAVFKRIMSFSACVLSWIFTIDYFFFGLDYKLTMSPEFVFDYWLKPDSFMMFIGGIVIIVIIPIVFLVNKIQDKVMPTILLSGILTITFIGTSNVIDIQKDYKEVLSYVNNEQIPDLRISRNGKNVVVIMLDRAIGSLAPYIFNERQELYDKFDGFTLYPNTLSYGISTNFGAPPLFGGYEYTVESMNDRDDQLLKNKHNESLKLMPTVFGESGYYVTVVDPPYADYRTISDLSIYDGIDNVHAYRAMGVFNEYGTAADEQSCSVRKRNIVFYSIFKMISPFMKEAIYNNGDYNSLGVVNERAGTDGFSFPQYRDGLYRSVGIDSTVLDSFSALESLKEYTTIDNSDQNCFLMMGNRMPHSFNYLQEPDYVPAERVDNTIYETLHNSRITPDGKGINMYAYYQVGSYQCNAASYISLSKWFDFLKEEGVWDNTRIIIVADHGYELGHFDNTILSGSGFDLESVNPVLMVKDFDSHGFAISDQFMTNADVPTLAFETVIENPVNPFTGNEINSAAKTEGPIKVLFSYNFSVAKNNGYRFEEGYWYTVHDSVMDINNWEFDGVY